MADSEKKQGFLKDLQVWKIIGIFAMVFLAVQLAFAFFEISISAIMDWLGASDNIRVFIGSTLSHAGMIAAVILICAPVIRKVFQQDAQALLFPFTHGWLKDALIGILLSGIVMILVFAVLLAFGQIRVERLALSGQPLDAWLRAIWLSVLVNSAAAVGEEVLFRGLLLSGLKKSWDIGGAVFISAVISSASHILAAGVNQTSWLKFIPLLALPGLMLGWAFLRRGNLWLATGIHFGWNLFQNDLLNLAAHQNNETFFGWLTAHNGPAWLLGNRYGIEEGLSGVISVILVSGGIWLFTKNRSADSG